MTIDISYDAAKQFLKDKGFLLVCGNIAFLLVFYVYGCEPKTTSMLYPERKVTMTELEGEFQLLIQQHQSRINDIHKQQEIRDIIIQQGLLIAEGGVINPIGLITTVLAILGIGAGADDLRVRKKLKNALTYEPVGDGIYTKKESTNNIR